MSYVLKRGDRVWLTFDPKRATNKLDAVRPLSFLQKLTTARRACFSHAQ